MSAKFLGSAPNSGHQRHGCANVAAAPRWRSPGGHLPPATKGETLGFPCEFSSRIGTSLIEMVVGLALFFLIFGSAMRLHTDSNLPQQGMIRDFAIALNICERFLNALENDILEGSFLAETPPDQDVTDAVLDSSAVQDYLRVFAGGASRESTGWVTRFRAFLTVKKESPGDLYRLRLRFTWGG